MLTAAAGADVIPTNVAKMFGGDVHINGHPAPIGTVVDAYDPDGVHCGTFTVEKAPGIYGYMSVYGNTQYSDVDEGAEPLDSIRFKVNGVDATPTVIEGNLLWRSLEMARVDLAITGVDGALSIADHPVDKEGAPSQTLRFWVGVQNDGNAMDQTGISASSTLGWTVRSNTEMPWAAPGEVVYTWFEVDIPNWPGDDRDDTLSFTVYSGTDPGVNVESRVVATATAGINYDLTLTTFPPDTDPIPPDATVRIEVGVTNTGNVDDGCLIQVSPNSYWSGSVDSTSGILPVGIGEEVTVWFDVTMPPYVQNEDSVGVFNYTVVSASDPSVTVSGAVLLQPDFGTDVNDGDVSLLPDQMNLAQNYPNPFNPTTTIAFSLSSRSQVNVSIFDILGRTVESIDMGVLSAGQHEVNWDASSMSSGVYFYRLTTGQGSQTRKMTLLK